MPPLRLSFAKDTWTLCGDDVTQLPFAVARTVMDTGSPSRFVSAMSFHACCGNVRPQPTFVAPRTVVISLHCVSTLTFVTLLVKSTSNRVAPAGGTHCTSSTFMFGGSSTPSGG